MLSFVQQMFRVFHTRRVLPRCLANSCGGFSQQQRAPALFSNEQLISKNCASLPAQHNAVLQPRIIQSSWRTFFCLLFECEQNATCISLEPAKNFLGGVEADILDGTHNGQLQAISISDEKNVLNFQQERKPKAEVYIFEA